MVFLFIIKIIGLSIFVFLRYTVRKTLRHLKAPNIELENPESKSAPAAWLT
jgi:hypothetical protein